jgi:acyl transferase domain-containing protein
VILKPLDKAIQANDPIRAIVKATGIGQDGRTKGITMPNGEAQSTLIKSVYQNSGLDPARTAYVEAHGTGTTVGDPIEAAALHDVFSSGRKLSDPLYVGSVKSNLGHLEGASGIVSLIKTAMMLQKGWILPNHDFSSPNPKIPLKKWNLEVRHPS